MKFFLNIITIFILTFLTVNTLSGQCDKIEQLTANTGTGTMVNSTTVIGQSFKACREGQLTSIKVKINFMGTTPINTVLKIAQGSNTNSNVLHSQNLTISNMGELDIPLSKFIPVNDGQTYAFSLGGSGDALNIDYSSTLGDTYPDGTLFQNTTPLPTADLFFSIALIGPAPDVIPTMSQWGLLILALLLLNVSIGLMYRKPIDK